MAASEYSFVFPDPDGESYGDYYPYHRSTSRRVSNTRPAPVSESPVKEEEEAPHFPPLMDGIEPFEDCCQYHAAGGCQIVLHQHYEGSRGDILRCKTCGRTFSSRRCGVLFKSRLPQELVESIISHFRRGDSIRETARELELNRGTVRRYYRLLEEHGG